jgi:asparagine synthase (glutamine-hydrolysing)
MLNSVEIRFPFLDSNLLELLVSLPDENKLFKGWTKYIFRKIFEKFLPKKIVWRKDKDGFSTNFDEKIKNKYYFRFLMKNYFNDNAIIFRENLVEKKSFLNSLINFYASSDKHLSAKKIFGLISLEEWLQSNKLIVSYKK